MSLPANWDPTRGNWDPMRAADADRDRAADVLKSAHADGRLDWNEYEERLDQVMRAQTHGELSRLVRDLPEGAPRKWTGVSPKPTEPMATASLALGILVPFTGITIVPSIILGHLALGKIKRDGTEGRALAIAGLAISYSFLGLALLGILVVLGLIWGLNA
ncbi:DUF1707 and DUF4190 domain-containing protein [Flindersiella endophytica]